MQLPLKWHGGKSYLASRIRSMFAPHTHYVEPFFGGGAVLLSGDGVGVSEVANDIDRRLTNFWRVLQLESLRWDLVDLLEHTPVSEAEWDRAFEHFAKHDCPLCHPEKGNGLCPCVHCAWKFFVLCRQSMAGRMQDFSPRTRTRTRRSMSEQASAWWTALNSLEQAGDRLGRVVVLNRNAVDVIRQEDGPDTLFYIDPPYMHGTRAAASVYHHEMGDSCHLELAAVLKRARGKVVLSGYESDEYAEWFGGWWKRTIDVPNHAAGGLSKRRMTECLWFNYNPDREAADPDSMRRNEGGPQREPEGATEAGE
jgi:DNA adenine methylase